MSQREGSQGSAGGPISEGGFGADDGTQGDSSRTPSGGANQAGAASDGRDETSYHGGDTGYGAGGLLPEPSRADGEDPDHPTPRQTDAVDTTGGA